MVLSFAVMNYLAWAIAEQKVIASITDNSFLIGVYVVMHSLTDFTKDACKPR